MNNKNYDVVIIGSGVAGLSAGLYAARYKLTTKIVGADLGGATTTAWTIENYPGFSAIDGYDLVMRMKEQVERAGVQVEAGTVKTISGNNQNFQLTLESGATLKAKTLILTMGSQRRKLGLPNETALNGKGIHYCTTCDSPLYKQKTIAVIGGGDASIKGVNLAAQHAKKVYLITREKELNGEPVNLERLKQFGERVEVFFETQVSAINATKRVESITLTKPIHGNSTLPIDGLFIEIGAIPANPLAKQLNVDLDKEGYVEVNEMMETNVPGVLAAGDLTNETGHFKQDIVAASQGALAATSAYKAITHRSISA